MNSFASVWYSGVIMVLVMVLNGALSVNGLTRLAFRLDDLQCGWMQTNAQTIMNMFAQYRIPLTVGVVTGRGDCWAADMRQRIARGDLIEVASHSVNHRDMATLSSTEQRAEAVNSRAAILRLVNKNATTFILPYNSWTKTTVSILYSAGYRVMSAQCSSIQTQNPYADNRCPSNMYPNIRPAFFPLIDRMWHVPVGASSAPFQGGPPLTVAKLVNGTIADCQNDQCSIASQVQVMRPLSETRIGGWSAVMMHPQDWADGDVQGIQRFFNQLLTNVKNRFDIRTIANMPKT